LEGNPIANFRGGVKLISSTAYRSKKKEIKRGNKNVRQTFVGRQTTINKRAKLKLQCSAENVSFVFNAFFATLQQIVTFSTLNAHK
jgi:hypothetical protein